MLLLEWLLLLQLEGLLLQLEGLLLEGLLLEGCCS